MAATPPVDTPEGRLSATGVRRLLPEETTIFEGTLSLLHCHVKDGEMHRGVFAVRMFPVKHPDHLISLHYTGIDEKDHEVGVIEDLSQFPAEAQALVRQSLSTHYHEQTVLRINNIRLDLGLLFFEVETQRGPEEFVMPWRGDRAEEYGDHGKILLDAFDNRYIIPNVSELPAADRTRFISFIYW